MAKRQLNATIDEGLYEVVENFQAVTGLPYTRIVAAALLHFLFDGLRNLEEMTGSQPDLSWVRVAMSLERGELQIGDLPEAVLDAVVKDADLALRLYERGGFPDKDGSRTKEHRQLLKRAREKKAVWQADIKEFGKMQAITELFGRTVPPKAQT